MSVAPHPRTAIVYVPAGVLSPTSTVICDCSPALIVEGVNETVVSNGAPVADSVRLCAAPFVTAVLIVEESEEPCSIVSLAGDSESENWLTEAATQPGSLKETIRVFQLKTPDAGRYSPVYQNVQSPAGSMLMLE